MVLASERLLEVAVELRIPEAVVDKTFPCMLR